MCCILFKSSILTYGFKILLSAIGHQQGRSFTLVYNMDSGMGKIMQIKKHFVGKWLSGVSQCFLVGLIIVYVRMPLGLPQSAHTCPSWTLSWPALKSSSKELLQSMMSPSHAMQYNRGPRVWRTLSAGHLQMLCFMKNGASCWRLFYLKSFSGRLCIH